MNKEIKAKWIKALRSGKYEQTTGVLHAGGSYCCLGVLCKIQGVADSVMDNYDNGDALSFPSEISKTVCAGLKFSSMKKLAELNDDKGFTFMEIADYVEAHY